MSDLLMYIANMAGDEGLFNPGTNAWDLRGSGQPTPTTHSQASVDDLFDDYGRSPLEIAVSNAGPRPIARGKSVPMDELMRHARAYTDITHAGQHELEIAGIDSSRKTNDTVRPISKERLDYLVSLLQQGDGSDDVESDDDASVLTADVAEATI